MLSRNHHTTVLAMALIMGLTGAMISSASAAQASPAVGLNIEVRKGATWYRATVVKKEGNRYLVHYEGASADFDEWVEADRIREAAQSFAPPTSPGDKPQTRAPAGRENGRNASTDAGDEMATPQVTPADASGAPDLTPGPQDEPEWSAKPDTPPAGKRRPTFQPIALFSETHRPGQPGRSFWEQFAAVLFSGPEAARAVVARSGGRPGGGQRLGRLECVDLALGKSVGFAEMPPGTELMDFAPDGTRVLLVADVFSPDKKERVDVQAVAPKPEHVVSFKPYDKAGDDVFTRRVDWAGFVDSSHVLTINSKGHLTLWELPALKAVYTITIAGTPVLSPGRKYLAAQVDKSLCVFEAATGKFLGRPFGQIASHSTVVFRPDGKQIAAVGGGRVRTWEFESGKPLADVVLPPKIWGNRLDFVSDDYLLLAGRYLIDPRLRVVLWEYQQTGAAAGGVFGGRYWYVGDGPRTGTKALASAVIPEPAVRKISAGMKPESLLAVKPGAAVSLEVNIDAPPDVRERAVKALTARLKADGLILADNRPLKLVAGSSSGETRQITYRFFGRRENQTTSVTELKLRLAFELEGKPLWEATSVSSAPHMISLKQNETVEDALAKHRANAWKFFESAEIPKAVPRLPEQTTYGQSRLTARGVESGASNVPPGAAQ